MGYTTRKYRLYHENVILILQLQQLHLRQPLHSFGADTLFGAGGQRENQHQFFGSNLGVGLAWSRGPKTTQQK